MPSGELEKWSVLQYYTSWNRLLSSTFGTILPQSLLKNRLMMNWQEILKNPLDVFYRGCLFLDELSPIFLFFFIFVIHFINLGWFLGRPPLCGPACHLSPSIVQMISQRISAKYFYLKTDCIRSKATTFLGILPSEFRSLAEEIYPSMQHVFPFLCTFYSFLSIPCPLFLFHFLHL